MDVSHRLMWAVCKGRLEEATELINTFGLSYSKLWAGGYFLLLDALEINHAAVVVLLLRNGCKVNSKHSSTQPSDTPLHIAVMNGDIAIVEMLLDRGALVDAKNQLGKTPLHNAIAFRRNEVAELLLKHGADVNTRDDYGECPLHVAVRIDCLHFVELLLRHGAYMYYEYTATYNEDEYTATYKEDYTPLHMAVEEDCKEIVALLLSKGANADIKGKDGITPLHIAVKKGYTHIIEDLLNHGACIDSLTLIEGYSPLHISVEHGCKEIVALLLSKGANVDIKGEDSITPLHIAVKKGYTHIVEDLLNHGACIDSLTLMEGYTPLHFACEVPYEAVVKLLLCRGADINASKKGNLTPLLFAIKLGWATVVELLLQHGAEVDNQDKNNKTALLLAVEKGDLTIVENILKFRPDVSNQTNRSSLYIALLGYKEIYTDIVKILLEYGLNVKAEDANNLDLISAAVEKGYLEIVENLLKYGADVSACEYKHGFTLLHVAAKNKQAEVAELLVRYGADVNAQNKTGKTAIFYATENADLKTTKLLLTNGINVKDDPELLHIAVRTRCIEIVKVLWEHGVDINTSDKLGRTALHFTAICENDAYKQWIISIYDDVGIDDDVTGINIRKEIAELLLSKGANVDAETKCGVTTLHAAILKSYTKLVEILLEYDANINSVVNGVPLLHLSAKTGCEEICSMLLNKGANVNYRGNDGMTALHIATLNHHLGVVNVLLQCGAEVDPKNRGNSTPLHIASSRGYIEIVETLLDYGADINITSRTNKTSLDYAMIYINSFPLGSFYASDEEHCLIHRRDIYWDKKTAEILRCHIVKMKTANLCVSGKNLLSMNIVSVKMRVLQDDCVKEIAIMEEEKINNSKVSFNDILTKCTSSLAILMKNENIVKALKSDSFKTKFPIYASMIKNNFRKGMERKELFELSHKISHFLFNNCLGFDSIDKIFSYLSNKDLRILIVACKPISDSSPYTNINDAADTSNISQVKTNMTCKEFL